MTPKPENPPAFPAPPVWAIKQGLGQHWLFKDGTIVAMFVHKEVIEEVCAVMLAQRAKEGK